MEDLRKIFQMAGASNELIKLLELVNAQNTTTPDLKALKKLFNNIRIELRAERKVGAAKLLGVSLPSWYRWMSGESLDRFIESVLHFCESGFIKDVAGAQLAEGHVPNKVLGPDFANGMYSLERALNDIPKGSRVCVYSTENDNPAAQAIKGDWLVRFEDVVYLYQSLAKNDVVKRKWVDSLAKPRVAAAQIDGFSEPNEFYIVATTKSGEKIVFALDKKELFAPLEFQKLGGFTAQAVADKVLRQEALSKPKTGDFSI